MITPIKQNVNFKGSNTNAAQKSFKKVEEYSKNSMQPVLEEEAKKTSIVEKFNKVKLSTINALKTINTTTGVSKGAIEGVIKGAATTAIVGFIGKNIKPNSSIKDCLKGIGGDLISAAKGVLEIVPNLLTKSPIENAKNAFKTIPNFYTQYLKGNKAVAFAATMAGTGAFAITTYMGKIKANRANANIDHSANTGHVSTK